MNNKLAVVLLTISFSALTHQLDYADTPWIKRKPWYAEIFKGNVNEMSPLWILQLYQMMKDTHEVLISHDLFYWPTGGSLIGVMRHKGLIAWDDDIDIVLHIKDEKKLLSLKPVFEKLEYDIEPFIYGYKIFPKNGIPFPGYTFKCPFIDIFFSIQRGNKFYYDPKRNPGHRRGSEPIYITAEELYPLNEYDFGEFKILGPNNPIPFLNAHYGSDWPHIAYKWNHFTNQHEKIVLTEEDKKSAQPTGPLENRVS